MGFPLGDGYHVLPKGKLASVVTWLEMKEKPGAGGGLPVGVRLEEDGRPEAVAVLPEGMRLERDERPEVEAYLASFRKIGEPWLWFGRLEWRREELERHLAAEGVEVYWLRAEGETVGMLELDRRVAGEVEIAYFGLVPGWTGRGVGRRLMAAALGLAWRGEVRRVWLHTCTVDHPGALGFYQSCGFRPYQRGLELSEDPRVRGVLGVEAGSHIPLL